MLQSIRSKVQGWVAITVLILISASFVLWGVEYYVERSSSEDKTVAKVNGQAITAKQLNTVTQQLQRAQQANGGAQLGEDALRQLKQYALRELISNSILVQSATKAGFNVSDDQMRQLVYSAPQFQVDGKFSEEKFRQLLYANNTTAADFFGVLRNHLISDQVAIGVQNSAFATPHEVRNGYELLKQQRNFGYFVIPTSSFVSKIKISDAEVKKYYDEHQNDFIMPEKVSVDYVVLSPQSISKTVQISPAEINQYYQNNISNFTQPKRWKLAMVTLPLPQNANDQELSATQKQMDGIKAKLKQGVSVEKLTKKQPTLLNTTEWYTEAQIPSELNQQLASLTTGKVSDSYKTDKGLSVVKVLAIEPSRVKSLQESSDSIKALLSQQKADQLFTKMSDQLSNLAFTNPTGIAEAAKQLNLPVTTSPLFTREGEKQGILSNPKVVAAAYSDDVLKQKNNSTPIELGDGGIMILRVHEYIPSKAKDLALVKNQIVADLTQQKAQRQAELLGYQIQSKLSEGQTLEKLAKLNNLTWIVKSNVTRDDKTIPPAILSAVFSLSSSTDKKPAITSLKIDKGGFALVQLLSIKKADYLNATQDDKRMLATNIANFMGQLEYRTYVRSIMSRAKVDVKIK